MDAKGCFNAEFFDPEIQKKDPKIMELVEKINSEPSFSFGTDSPPIVRHWGSVAGGRVSDDEFPQYKELHLDAIFVDQILCFNKEKGMWEHAISYVIPSDVKQLPDDVVMTRSIVGRFVDGEYESFTYLQEANKEPLKSPNLSGLASKKADTVMNAFKLWQGLIDAREQVGVGLPYVIYARKTDLSIPNDYESVLAQVASNLPIKDPSRWKDFDLQFLNWAMSTDNQLKYFGEATKVRDFIQHDSSRWKYWGEQAALGKMPEPVLRTVTKKN